jgi:hypothetical protein
VPPKNDFRPKTNRDIIAQNTEQSDPRPMKPSVTTDSRPSKFGPRIKPGSYPSASETVTVSRNNNNSGTNPNASASVARPDSRPIQKSPNSFMRVQQQNQPSVDQARRPQENADKYNQKSRPSNNQTRTSAQPQRQPSKQNYGNGSQSRQQIAYNQAPVSRGDAPSGGRVNSGGGNSGGRR